MAHIQGMVVLIVILTGSENSPAPILVTAWTCMRVIQMLVIMLAVYDFKSLFLFLTKLCHHLFVFPILLVYSNEAVL